MTENMTSPQVIDTQIDNNHSTIQTRKVDMVPEEHSILNDTSYLKCESSSLAPWVNRPFYVATLTWPTTANRFSMLTSSIINIPRDIFRSNSSLSVLVRLASLYRYNLCLNVSITGTISHQGMLLASILPPNSGATGIDANFGRRINTMLSGPHSFLSANEASSTCLEVPFYCNSDYDVMDPSQNAASVHPSMSDYKPANNLATFGVMVLNPLVPATGASTSLNIVVEAYFKELELKVPTPRYPAFQTTAPTSIVMEGQSAILYKAATNILNNTASVAKTLTADAIDMVRNTIRSYTGLHNPNNPRLEDKHIMSLRNYNNTVDSTVCYERLDPYTSSDRITREPVFNSIHDEMSIKSIISKPQYLGTFTVSSTNTTGALLWARPMCPWQGGNTTGFYVSNNIELMYLMTRAWKGTLKIHIQSSMTNKQNVKLKVLKYYNPARNINVSYPLMSSIASAPSDLLEFSAGNQINTFELPYLNRNKIEYNTRQHICMANQSGMYYIYLAQPLVVGDSAPLNVEFNVYMSCADDFQFYGYSTQVARVIAAGPSSLTLREEKKETKKKIVMTGQSAEVMNKPSGATKLRTHTEEDTELDATRLIPLVDVRPLIRRNQFGLSGTTTIGATGSATTTVNLGSLICENYDSFYRGSVGVVPAMFYGKTPSLKFKLVTKVAAQVQVAYVPPNAFMADSTAEPTYYSTSCAGDTATTPGFWLDFPTSTTNPGLYPVPQIEFPTYWTLTSSTSPVAETEFAVPNVTKYKFVGGPEKMDNSTTISRLAVADFGNLYFAFTGNSGDIVQWVLYYSYADEARLGFQVIAPILQLPTATVSSVPKLMTPHTETTSTTVGLPNLVNNTFLFYSNLTTSYT